MMLTPSVVINKTNKRRLFTLDFDFKISRDQLLEELENEDWRSPGDYNPLGIDLWSAQRSKVLDPRITNRFMHGIRDYLQSNQLKMQLIGKMFEHLPDLTWEYNWNPESCSDETILHAEFTRDAPRFVNVLHTDYRKLVATGMIYLTESDSEDLCTMFYDTQDRQNPVRMETNFGQGWWHANGNDTWHEGWNRTDSYRYSILLGLTMNVVPVKP